MSGDEESSLVSDNSKTAFRDNSESVKYNKRKDASESELIRRRKEGKKQRQEKLIDNLEREKNKTGHIGPLETNQSKTKKLKFEPTTSSQKLDYVRCIIFFSLPIIGHQPDPTY